MLSHCVIWGLLLYLPVPLFPQLWVGVIIASASLSCYENQMSVHAELIQSLHIIKLNTQQLLLLLLVMWIHFYGNDDISYLTHRNTALFCVLILILYFSDAFYCGSLQFECYFWLTRSFRNELICECELFSEQRKWK